MRKILLVEDEPTLREVYKVILSREPYELHIATDGQEALEKCEHYNYDLILLDLMMPVLDGLGFLEKYQPGKKRTKIIVLSNLSGGDELTKALNMGAYKNILKSDLSPRQLLAAVRYELEA